MKIEEITHVTTGSLVSRLQEDPSGEVYYLYDQYAHAKDQLHYISSRHEYRTVRLLDTKNLVLIERNDLIINLSSCEVAYPKEEHIGFILPYNYCKITVDSQQVIPNYLRSWFNESPEAKKQLHLNIQGATLVKKLSVQQIKKLNIALPDLQYQKLIGNLFMARLLKELKYKERESLLNKLISNKLYNGGTNK